MIEHSLPELEEHEGITVIRDTLVGGTKSRYLWQLFLHHHEVVYASSAEGTAQVALAACAQRWGKRAVIFGPARATPHPRQLQAQALGATFVAVKPGYLNVCQSKAKAWATKHGSHCLPFGAVTPQACPTIAETALALRIKPKYVWAASGSGTLISGLRKAWPTAEAHCVQVGHQLSPEQAAGAEVHDSGFKYSWAAPAEWAPFDADPHYELKGWHALKQWRDKAKPKGSVLFWCVTGSAQA